MLQNWRKIIAEIFHWPTVAILLAIGILFVALIFKNFYFTLAGSLAGNLDSHEIVEEVFAIFLQIEIVASIKIYFASNLHFPLRFFLYVAVTDLIRNLIVHQNEPHAVLLFAVAIVLTVAALKLWEIKIPTLNPSQKQQPSQMLSC